MIVLDTAEETEMRYVAFLHDDAEPGFGISFPDFPGCVSDGDTVEDALRRGAEALSLHVEGMLADGETVPQPRSLHDVNADGSLAGWRDGATIAFVPLILDAPGDEPPLRHKAH